MQTVHIQRRLGNNVLKIAEKPKNLRVTQIWKLGRNTYMFVIDIPSREGFGLHVLWGSEIVVT